MNFKKVTDSKNLADMLIKGVGVEKLKSCIVKKI